MRLRRLVAVARRDLAQELGGRRGWVLPAILAGLLLPASAIPPLAASAPREAPVVTVTGAVPPAVQRLEGVRRVEAGARVRFVQRDDVLVVEGPIPDPIREALDAGHPVVRHAHVGRPLRLPTRALLFALISASTLTGAVSASIAGERSRRTLSALLTAAITRGELVAGKWLAWAGLGGGTSLLAALVAIGLGRVESGPWLVPMVTVPAGTVALGLFLARRAADVVGGTTVSLRVLPAALSILGVVAWFLGREAAWLGAAVPLGGALIAAGSTWPGLVPPLVAAGSTIGFTVAALAVTARDLEEMPVERRPVRPVAVLASAGGIAAAAWWVPVLVPLLWGAAGNPLLTETLPLDRAVLAGGLGLLLATVVRAARSDAPVAELGLARPRPGGAVLAVAIGLALVLVGPTSGLLPLAPELDAARLRLMAGVSPGWAGLPALALVAVADELLFRGWLLRAVGPIVAVIAWTAVKAPLDPLHGLLTGALLVALTRATGSVGPAIAARLVWGALAGVGVASSAAPAWLVGLACLALLALLTRGRAVARAVSR